MFRPQPQSLVNSLYSPAAILADVLYRKLNCALASFPSVTMFAFFHLHLRTLFTFFLAQSE